MAKKRVSVLLFAVITALVFASNASAQQQENRNLWIAKFTCETKAAAAVAATQAQTTNALKYSNLFNPVTTFETDAKQPEGTWSLTANETDYYGGNAATRALIGYGAGRARIEIEYKLTDPSSKVVWTQKIKTKPPFSWGQLGAVQNQGVAADEQGQRLTDALSKYFGIAPAKK
jgi:Domain of unknown function (DUF4410)